MQIAEGIHSIEIPFKIPVGPGETVGRTVYVFLVLGERLTLIDSGVSGSETRILDYVRTIGRDPKEISALILSHSHPDHIGAARAIREATGCTVMAHEGEKDWIEDTAKQSRERPVPGFGSLVQGPVEVDRFLEDGDALSFGKGVAARVIHTPGHSRGSISLLFGSEGEAIFSGDAVLLPGDLPMYEDISDSVGSLRKLAKLGNIELMFSSWETAIQGHERIKRRMEESVCYLQRIHETVLEVDGEMGKQNLMELCRQVAEKLNLPPFAANPIAARAFASSLAHRNMVFKELNSNTT